jgi:hypothetical protein
MKFTHQLILQFYHNTFFLFFFFSFSLDEKETKIKAKKCFHAHPERFRDWAGPLFCLPRAQL